MSNNKKPTVAGIIAALKENYDLSVDKNEITEEIYEKATKGWERGLSDKSIANRARFYLVGNESKEPKETIPVTGVFVGSKDICSEKKPLGKNKSHMLSFLQLGDDGLLRVFSDPSSPSHFKGFKKSLFGDLVNVEMAVSKSGEYTYVSPEKPEIIEKGFELDTSKIVTYDINSILDLPDFSYCAVTGKISSIRFARVPTWEQDKYETEDYPLSINKNPVFALYLQAGEGEPVVKGIVNPTHLGKPYIKLDDFDALWPTQEDVDDGDDEYFEDLLTDEINPTFNGVEVILIGQRKKASETEETTFVDFEINAILQVDGSPVLMTPEAPVKKAKTAKETSKKKDKGVPSKKPDPEKAAQDKEAMRNKVRQEEVAKVVATMRDATTVDVVMTMVDPKFLKGVSPEKIQEFIDAEFVAQGIGNIVEDAPADEESVWDEE